MTFKRKLTAFLAACITAILWIALCGCEDLGAYESTEDYYASFGEVVFLGGAAKDGKSYSVKDYFYNEKSREDFLTDENGVYSGVEHSDYVYVAIPLNKDIKMDSLAMYLQAKEDVTLYVNVYITDTIPKNWKKTEEIDAGGEESAKESDEAFEYISDVSLAASEEGGTEDVPTYDDPALETRVAEIAVYLKGGVWDSFTVNSFKVNNSQQSSIQLTAGQYILLQIRNNSGVRDYNAASGTYVDPQTGLVLDKAEITMTNMLIRALDQ